MSKLDEYCRNKQIYQNGDKYYVVMPYYGVNIKLGCLHEIELNGNEFPEVKQLYVKSRFKLKIDEDNKTWSAEGCRIKELRGAIRIK